MSTDFDAAIRHARIASLRDAGYGLIEDGALAWREGRIVYLGPDAGLPAHATTALEIDAAGALLTPGLIDCHTHLVFAGQRAAEFEQRLEGASYADIALAGGGIMSSVRATRAASEAELLEASRARAAQLLADGVTTIEIKSGYGLDAETEARCLRVARALGTALGITVSTTYLGAHAVPAEYRDRRSEYLDTMIASLPALARAGLIDAVDAYCESIAFSPGEVARVFDAAHAAGLKVKLHADQLSDSGGAALAARYQALSADHLEYTNAEGVAAMAAAGTVAVLLPAAYYALRETRLPPIDALRTAGVPMAVASDLNPGTSPMLSLRLALGMACTLFRLTPLEALRGATVYAARALGMEAHKGRLEPGTDADVVLWNAEDPAELCYWIGGTLARDVFARGKRLTATASS